VRAAAARQRAHIQDLTSELHHKLALWLCQNYETVLLPAFSPKSVSAERSSSGKPRRLGRKSVRRLTHLSPYTFRQFILHKAREHGTEVVVCDEAYTSKTCTVCGRLNAKLGGSKHFVCPAKGCGAEYDRDAGAARNVLLRYYALQCVADEDATPGGCLP
jgi:putative transposase